MSVKDENIKVYNYSDFGLSNMNYNPLDDDSLSLSYTGEDLSLNKLIYLHSRYYDPLTRQFLSKDSYEGNIYENTTLNGYNYCNSNPINYIDPTGHSFQRPTVLSDGGGYSYSYNATSKEDNKPKTNPARSIINNTYDDTYYSSSTSISNTTYSSYNKTHERLSKNNVSSSASEQYNLSIWQKALNSINNISSSYSDFKQNISNKITKTNLYKTITNSKLFNKASNFINNASKLVKNTIKSIDNYMDKHPVLKTVVGVAGVAAGITLAAFTGGAAAAVLTSIAVTTKIGSTALKTGSLTEAIYQAGKTSIITGAIGAVGSIGQVTKVVKLSNTAKQIIDTAGVVTSGILATKCAAKAVKQVITSAVIIEDPNTSFKDKAISVLDAVSSLATAGNSLLAFGNSLTQYKNTYKKTKD